MIVDAKDIRILRGSLVIGKISHIRGDIVPVEAGLLSWLERKRSSTFAFEVVDNSSTEIVEIEKTISLEAEPEKVDIANGEGEILESEIDKPISTEIVEEVRSDETGIGLEAVDATVSAALAQAGFDSVEKLRVATEDDLVRVRGIGIARARAILSEVNGGT